MRALWVIDFKPGWPIYIYIQDEAALGSDQERSNPNRLCGHPALRLSCSHPCHRKIATFWCSPDAPCIEPSVTMTSFRWCHQWMSHLLLLPKPLQRPLTKGEAIQLDCLHLLPRWELSARPAGHLY